MKIYVVVVLFSLISFAHSFGQTRKDNFFVLVGEKINILPIEPVKNDTAMIIYLDYGLKGKYKVLENIYGNYKKDTIEFEAYFHCGGGLFTTYKNVLLFISKENGKFYLEKYQYYDVYKTVDSRWASPGDTSKFDQYHTGNIRPHDIQFVDTVSYDIRQPNNGCLKKINFPKPYYRIEGDRAIALMGFYADELFDIKKESVLKKK